MMDFFADIISIREQGERDRARIQENLQKELAEIDRRSAATRARMDEIGSRRKAELDRTLVEINAALKSGDTKNLTALFDASLAAYKAGAAEMNKALAELRI